jgi:hypothetical protein
VICAACGHEAADGAKFCTECGAAFARRCASCQSELPGAAKFCAECGTPVAATAPKAEPRAYTPKTLAPFLCEWRAELAGVTGADAARRRLLSEAEDGYRGLGATGHAERLAQQRGA